MRPLLATLMMAGALLGAASPAPAEDVKLVMAGAAIPKVFEPGKGGPYNAFYDDVVAKAPVQLDMVMLPVKRLARSFFEKQVDCMYMATDDKTFYIQNGVPLETLTVAKPFNRLFMRAYSRPGGTPPGNWAAFDGKLIAGDEGIHVSTIAQRTLPFAKSMLYTKSVDEAFELLAAGRVDVAIAYSIDARQYFTRAQKPAFPADKSFSLLTLGEGVTCWPSLEASKLVEYLDAVVERLHADGTLLSRYGFELHD
ncbi:MULTISPECIES: transporter substrate-binding domain-containing protein [Kordiimonas]|jgi:hypothetical protein|uniref:transporter substrate-binding domain-containing protein n=1 Tax=Kordiimonas TaxID=288021 RepID=UPI00257AB69D|nr:transporter substrate-binding domain-containing protein [Kordiimonas sp. UBA4487]